MNQYQHKSNQINNVRVEEMREQLTGYWNKNTWDTEKELMEYNGDRKTSKRYIDFNGFPEIMKIELKFFSMKQLQDKTLSVSTLTNISSVFHHIQNFINKKYPFVNSYTEFPGEKVIDEFRLFLIENGIKITQRNINSHPFVTAFKNIRDFIVEIYDDREEFEKDIWDARNINNASYTKNDSNYKVNFTILPKEYRKLVKSYCKIQVKDTNIGTINHKVAKVGYFLNYLYKNGFLKVESLKEIKRKNVEDFLTTLHIDKGNFSKRTLQDYVSIPREFLLYLERNESEYAPEKSVNTLIYDEDIPKRNHKINDDIKYIPDDVLLQLEKVLSTEPEELNPPMEDWERSYIPIVILMIASGWRISDILNLRYDSCLVKTEKGFYLQGDISKTNVEKHRVPIEEELAKLLIAVIDTTKEKSTADNNPDKYLFVRYKGRRKGDPFNRKQIQEALNGWANKYNIIESEGKIYHFKNHAFRHTKAVELVNNGMNLLHVQKWMAHASPEMTLVYAKLNDDSLRREWELAKEKSSFLKIDYGTGQTKELADEDLIEWEYIRQNIEAAKVPMGYCMASKKMGCPYIENPCLTCNNFCTTPENIPEFDIEIKHTEDLVKRTKDMPVWNEKNQRRLEKLLTIRETLSSGKIHHPAGKKAREVLKD